MYSDHAPLPPRSQPTFYFDYQSLLVFNSHFCRDSAIVEADLVVKDEYHSDARIFFGDDRDGSDTIPFRAKKIFITGPTHDSTAQGELVVEHHASSSSQSQLPPICRLFLCIPLGLAGPGQPPDEKSCDIELIVRNATSNKMPNISDLSLKHAICSNDLASFSVVAAASSSSAPLPPATIPFSPHHLQQNNNNNMGDVIILVAHKQLMLSSDIWKSNKNMLSSRQLPILQRMSPTTSRESTTLLAADTPPSTSATPESSSARIITEGMEGGDGVGSEDNNSQQLGSAGLSAIMSLCGCTLIAFLFLSVQYAIRNDVHRSAAVNNNNSNNNTLFVTVIVIFLWSVILCGNFVCVGLQNHLQLNYWLAAVFGFLATSCSFFFFFSRSSRHIFHIFKTYFCMRWVALLSIVCVLMYCNLLLLDPNTTAFIELGVGMSSVAFMIADAQKLLPHLLPRVNEL